MSCRTTTLSWSSPTSRRGRATRGGRMHMQTKLVLFKGNPFTGKSTLSEYAAQQIALNGQAVEWVCEGEMLEKYFPHVLAVLDQTQPISDEALWAEWSAFVQTIQSAPATFVV